MEHKYVVGYASTLGWAAAGSLAGEVESGVEEFPTVEFSSVVGLFDDVDMVVGEQAFLELVAEECVHVW